jgi:uncharacterized protein DUF4038/collagenase-like protein with putative collagen-binding domain
VTPYLAEQEASLHTKNRWCGLVLASLLPFVATTLVAAPDFPLRPSVNRHYLEDQRQRPFFISGDSPWDIFQNVDLVDARSYLDDRKRRGFNTLLVTFVADRHDLMTNKWGEYPFQAPLDFTQPNEAYWKRVDAVMKEMTERGFLVVACPTWLGAGSKPIWRDGVKPAAMESYGAFLLKRYGSHQNLIWLLGGDRNPESESETGIRTLAEILHRGAPHQLISYHASPGSASARFFHKDPWLGLNSAYTYGLAYEHVLPEWRRRDPALPVFLSETGYDGEDNGRHDWTPLEVRKQHYWALTNGAAGHVHGAKQLWWFGPGWQEWLERPATSHIQHARTFFEAHAWWKLVPDSAGTFLTEGAGDRSSWEYATAALADDGSWGLMYVPASRDVTVDLSRLRGPATARWYDPTSGALSSAHAATLENRGRRRFTPPGANAGGDRDWVLVLEVLGK